LYDINPLWLYNDCDTLFFSDMNCNKTNTVHMEDI
jgi:hypothetical protein